MTIEPFKSNWATEEHEMVYDSALKMLKVGKKRRAMA